jgi:hypothetical protein
MSEDLPPDVDDPSIPDEEFLYRRIPLQPSDNIQRTEIEGEYRPSSGNFRSNGPLSLDRASLTTPEQTRDHGRPRIFHVAQVPAKVARQYGCRLVKDPIPDNPAHILLFGNHDSGDGALNGRQAKAIARAARIVLLSNADLPQ